MHLAGVVICQVMLMTPQLAMVAARSEHMHETHGLTCAQCGKGDKHTAGRAK
eukprot:SAG11_NODE_799_length_7127_cov_3.180279_13_plen_52_part_00